MRRKELLAAAYIRDILFCSNDEVDLYIHELELRCVQYENRRNSEFASEIEDPYDPCVDEDFDDNW